MSYKDIVKHIIDNFVFTRIEKEFTFTDVEFSEDNQDISGPSERFFQYFDHNFYKVGKDYVHDKEIVNFLKTYKKLENLSFDSAMKSDKKIILEMSLHPVSGSITPHKTIKENFIDVLFKDKNLLKKMREGKLFLLLNQGWEPQDFTEKTRETDTIENYYELFNLVFKQYNLPNTSIILMGSNVRNDEFKKQYNPNCNKVSTIIDNFMEIESFCAYSKEVKLDLDYSFDEHIDNIKKSNKTLLRVSRTLNGYRNQMLYFIYKNNYQNKSIIEHKTFDTNKIAEVFKLDKDILEKINNDLPLVASKYEIGKDFNQPFTSYSNETIPYDVYKKTIFSWTSTSLPEQINKVYLSQSTFNPMLFYHPIVWHGQPYHIKYLKSYGYKSYDWLFDESYDNIDKYEWEMNFNYPKLKSNMRSVEKVMNMDRDKLINKIIDNKDILEHNRNLLIQCKSIERIITKFYETTI